MINTITIISPGYPTKTDPYYPFVQQLAEEIADQGVDVTVVAPQSITHSMLHGVADHPTHRIDKTKSGRPVKVFQPYYLTFPYKYKKINSFLLSLALKKTLLSLPVNDVYYAHFWQTGYSAFRIIKKIGKPLVVATGESEIAKMISFSPKWIEFSDAVSSVVAVSSKNKNESVRLGLIQDNKCKVFPNAIDETIFYKMNKHFCRKALNISQDVFVVVYVGWFIERKGAQRVAAAINKVKNVNSIFIGKGPLEPICDGILFKGSLPHKDIPLYLNAADVFVLPTLNEGCCNAVVEAMACGLPIISSNLSFNWDVLDESNSIMVNPNSVSEIANAIRVLRDDEKKRLSLAEGALRKAQSLTIDKRAKNILDFINTMIK